MQTMREDAETILREAVAAAHIYQEIYGSDHCPVTLTVDLPFCP